MDFSNINIRDSFIFKKCFKKNVIFSLSHAYHFSANNTKKYKNNLLCYIYSGYSSYTISLSLKKFTRITELIYFIAFYNIHIANKLKRERIRLKEHFRKHIKNIIECLPGGKVYQECKSRFNQLQDELNT